MNIELLLAKAEELAFRVGSESVPLFSSQRLHNLHADCVKLIRDIRAYKNSPPKTGVGVLVHNHGPREGAGLGCPETRGKDGQLRGACIPSLLEAAGETVDDVKLSAARRILCEEAGDYKTSAIKDNARYTFSVLDALRFPTPVLEGETPGLAEALSVADKVGSHGPMNILAAEVRRLRAAEGGK